MTKSDNIPMSLGRRLLLVLTVVLPLFFVLDLRDTFDLPKMALVYVGTLTLIGLGVVSTCRQKEIVWKRTALDLPLLVFFLIALLSTFGSVSPVLSMWGAYRIYVFGLVPLCAFAVLYWGTAQIADEELAEQLTWGILLSGAIVGVYALLQYAGLELFDRMPKVESGRPWSSLGNPLYAGSIGMMSSILAWKKKGPAALVLFLFSMIGLVLSQSRSAWLGFLVAISISFWFERGSFQKSRWIFLIALTGILLAAFPQSFQRSKVLLSSQESSNTARVEGWKAAVKIWKAHPWLGSGPDTFLSSFRKFNSLKYSHSSGRGVSQADAHNDFLQVASTMGTLGLLAYIGILFFGGKWVVRALPTQRAGIALALVSLFVQNQFNFSSVSAFGWAAIMAGLVAHSDNTLRVSLPRWVTTPVSAPFLLILLLAGHVLVVRPVLADYRYQQGMAWSAGGRLEEARRSFKEAIRLQGRIEDYQMAYANRCRDLKYFDEAWATAERLVREHPANPDVWNNQGVIAMWLTQLANLNRMEEAGLAFKKAVELDPFFLEAWANRARWEHIAGNLAEEHRLWEKVLEIDPTYEMALRVLHR